ncbi:uncharacterized protein LOC111477113 isoform X2 [Cucurbita maxima]|uniref:Uncharacterized protein LOC111477113 isoform X2 n=1 Tax=Cucurbita maxima TaxID=3661 RepID=A0A6J1IKP7_CUCMA|nr:uncharacterized protein LOC111477113 isoform X2 [Cucurbita maxima]
MFSEIDYPITLWRANLICNVASSLASGFSRPLAKHLDPHLIFSLEGPAVCGSTRDFIENFCVADLLKMGMILILSYFGSQDQRKLLRKGIQIQFRCFSYK